VKNHNLRYIIGADLGADESEELTNLLDTIRGVGACEVLDVQKVPRGSPLPDIYKIFPEQQAAASLVPAAARLLQYP
jgi:hypothetical protein